MDSAAGSNNKRILPIQHRKRLGRQIANIAIIGAGTWGTALARILCNAGNQVTVWSALQAEIEQLNATRQHKNLPNMAIPEDIQFTIDLREACGGKELLFFAVPSVFVRETAKKAAPYIEKDQVIVDVAKGIEPVTLNTMSEVIREEIPGVPVVVFSGPTHAEEVAQDLPTTIVAACEDIYLAEKVQDVFSDTCMRVYTNTDVKGVEICGALKNIIALASGISAGLGYGDNTKAALITRGLAEMRRLGAAMGCRDETFAGLAGIGDLIVTATSRHSRNNQSGYLIGQGYKTDESIAKVGMVVEGINALPAALSLAEKYHVEMPIVEAVNRIIHGENPADTVSLLMGRKKKTELMKPV